MNILKPSSRTVASDQIARPRRQLSRTRSLSPSAQRRIRTFFSSPRERPAPLRLTASQVTPLRSLDIPPFQPPRQRRLFFQQMHASPSSPSSARLSWATGIAILVSLAAFYILFSPKAAAEEDELTLERLQPLLDVLKSHLSDLDLSDQDLPSMISSCLHATYQACLAGKWNLIDQILQKDPTLISLLKGRKGHTLLTLAIESGEEAVVVQLLQRRIGLQDQDHKGNTPLHLAAQVGLPSLSQQLLKDFSPQSRNQSGETPLHVAIRCGQEGALQPFLNYAVLDQQSKKEGNLLHWAVYCGQFRMIDYLLTRHYQIIAPLIEKPDSEGRTPLSLAAYLGETYSIHALIKHGADRHAKDPQGNTPLHWACKGLQPQSIDTLADHGVKLNPFNRASQRPEDLLHQAPSQRGQETLLHFLNIQSQGKPPKASEPLPQNLVFQGGGPKGIAYVAVLEELEKRQILGSVKRIAGTSAGAITAALIAVGYTSEKLNQELANQNLSEWLDYKQSHLSEEIRQKHHLLSQIVDLKLAPYDGIKALYNGWTEGGLCQGEAFLNWMEKRIQEATGIPHCTLGELEGLMTGTIAPPSHQSKDAYKHLHLFATQIGDNPNPVHFSTEDPQWKDVIISDAIRMSMSIPIAFKPHIIHKKDNKGERIPCPELGKFVDGGLLTNFPMEIFDHKQYKPHRTPDEDPTHKWHNPATWGFSLYNSSSSKNSSSQKRGYLSSLVHWAQSWISTPSPMINVIQSCASLLWDAEIKIKGVDESYASRTLRIDDQGVGLMEFNLDPEKKNRLLESGRKEIQSFLRDYKRGKLGLSSLFYDEGLFEDKSSQGLLFLPRPHLDFTGRIAELHQLEQEFLGSPDWTDQAPIKTVVAASGYGKSELAIAFACHHLKQFSRIWHIDLKNPETFQPSYQKLAKALGISPLNVSLSQLAQQINDKLQTERSSPWLLIFDNADEGIPVDLPTKGGCVLITSQPRDQLPNPFHLKPFSDVDARKLIAQITDEQGEEVNLLAQKLNQIPVLINQAAHYIAHQPGCKPIDYLNRLQSKTSQNSSDEELMTACWEMASEYLNDQLPETTEWLALCAYLNDKNIPKKWLLQWLASKEGQKSSLKDYKKQQEILGLLKKFGLISSHPYDETFSMHGLLQKVLVKSRRLDQEGRLKTVVHFISDLDEVKQFNPTHPDTIGGFRQALPHCVSLMNHVKEGDPLKVQLLLTMVRGLIETERDFSQAESYLKKLEEIPSLSSPVQGRIAFLKGLIYRKQASLRGASGGGLSSQQKEALYLKALKAFDQARSLFMQDDHPSHYHHLEQNPDKCHPLYQKAIALEYQGETELDLADLGVDCLSEAEKKLENALQEFKDYLGELEGKYPNGEHFDVARILREQGRLWKKKGDLIKARDHILKALAMQERVYGKVLGERADAHPTVAATYTELGDVYVALQAWYKADQACKEAIQINTRAFRTEHNEYNRRLYEKRAKIAEKMNDPDKAQKMKNKHREIQNVLSKRNKD